MSETMRDNKRYNEVVGKYADYAEADNDPHGHGKRVPYLGWFWRTVDFADLAGSSLCVEPDLKGFMENNKWEYRERGLSDAEASAILDIVDDAVRMEDAGDAPEKVAARLADLWPLMQAFPEYHEVPNA